MLRHVVVWQMKGDSAEERRERAEACAEVLRPLAEKVPQLRALSVGVNELHLGANADLVLIADLDDADSLAAYDKHPDHQAAGAVVRENAASRSAVDFTL